MRCRGLVQPLLSLEKPASGFIHEIILDGHVEQTTLVRDSVAVNHVEQGLPVRRRHLILDDLHAAAGAEEDVSLLQVFDAPDVQADRRVELKRESAGGRLRAAEHHTDLVSNLIDEDQAGLRV